MFSSVLEKIVQLDTSLFSLLNGKTQNAVFDFLMPILTNLDYWRIPIALLLVSLAVFGKKRGRIGIILLILGITLSDQICNSLIKPMVGRIRPCNVLENVHLLVNCTNTFSFPSSHATNMFAGTLLLSFVYPRWRVVLLLIATVVAYSRVYVGVHYPFDVLAGIILGIICALVAVIIFKFLSKKFSGISYEQRIEPDQN